LKEKSEAGNGRGSRARPPDHPAHRHSDTVSGFQQSVTCRVRRRPRRGWGHTAGPRRSAPVV